MALTLQQKEAVIEMRNRHMSYKAISVELSVTRDQVRDYCRTRTAKSYGLKNNTNARYKERQNKMCKFCQKEFDYKKSNSMIYCSQECKNKNNEIRKEQTRKNKTKLCKNCGIEFIPSSGTQVYCSKDCRLVEKQCEACGNSFVVKRTESLDKRKYCSDKCKHTIGVKRHEEYYNKFSSIHKGKVVPVTLYNGSEKDMTVYCLMCTQKTTRKASQFLDKNRVRGCANCAKTLSVGEDRIERWLNDNGVPYIKQYTVDTLVDKAPLRYDFAITNEQGDVIRLLEYDGRQHYEPVDNFGGVKEFNRQKKSDAIKDSYAKDTMIELVRISYKNKDVIENILQSTLLSRPSAHAF